MQSRLSETDFKKYLKDIFKEGVTNGEIMDLYSNMTAEYYEEQTLSHSSSRCEMSLKEMSAVRDGSKNIKILDAGAGTGIIGQALHEANYKHIDALEPNEELLKNAVEKKIYKNVYQDFLGTNKLNIEDNTYDAIISVGVFTEGHAREDCFEELIRITKPGGHIVIITGEDYILNQPFLVNFEPRIYELQSQGVWHVTRRVVSNYSKFCNPGNGIIYRFVKL